MIARVAAAVVLALACVAADDEPLRLGSTAWRHAGPLTGVVFVDGGERVITASLDGTWAVRDPDSGEALARVGNSTRPVLGLSAGDDGAWLAVTIRDGIDEAGDPRVSTIVYDRGREVFVEPFHVEGTAVLSRDGRRLARRMPGERRVTVFDVESRDEVATLVVGREGDEAPWWVALSDDGAWLLAGGRRATSRRDATTWVDVHPVDGGDPTRHVFDGAPLAFAASGDGRGAAAVAADGTLHVVAPDAADVVVHELGDPTITALAFVDDARVVTRGRDGITLRALGEHGSSAVLWTAPSLMPVLDFAVDVPGGRIAPIGRASDVTLLALSDGRRLDAPVRHPGRITALGVAPGGDAVVTGGWTGELMTWDAASGERTAATDTGAGVISGVGFLGDGRFVVAAGREGRVVVLDRERDLEVVADASLGEPILALDVAPDGARIATGHRDGVVRTWTPADDGTLAAAGASTAGRRHVTSLAWSPDGARLAVVVTSELHVVDAATGDVVGSHDPRCPIADVAWAGNRIALALATRITRVLDDETLDEVFTTPRRTARVEVVALSADAGRVASATTRRSEVDVFDVGDDGDPLVLDGHAEDVSCLAWRGELLVAGSADGTALVWRP